jgi:hypothetical protein
MATKDDDSIPNLEITAMNNTIRNPQKIISDKNSMSVGSMSRLIMIFRETVVMNRMTHIPIIKSSNAAINFGA